MAFLLATALFGVLVTAGPRHYPRPGGYSSHHNHPTVHLRNGSVTGTHSATYNQDFFLGVPYAKAPVGGLRFRNPHSIDTKFNGTLHATAYAPECVGYGGDQIGYPVSEDCLYYNVIRPSGYEHERLPVAVWIHGGGLYEGGTRDERYNLSFIVQNSVAIGKPIIGISIAYRLSAWGFLVSEEVVAAGQTNIGLRDQRLALHYIQENIAAFGGDPAKVTIWVSGTPNLPSLILNTAYDIDQGESAGAASVGWHLTAYNGRDDGLFRAGIMESGNPVNYASYLNVSASQPIYDALVQTAGCDNSTNSLDCLRTAPFETLNAFLNNSVIAQWSPIVDGDIIARYASLQLAEGAFVKAPIISGANSEEGTAFGPMDVNTDEEFLSYLSANDTSVRLPSQVAPEVLEAYPNTCSYFVPSVDEVPCDAVWPAGYGAEYRRTSAYAGDAVMIANRRGACETWAKHGLSAYCYRFNTIPAGLPWFVGVTHFQEVAFVFDNINGLGYDSAHASVNPFANKSQSYIDLASLMSKSWASFVYDLDPNGDCERPSTTPDWPVYDLETPLNIVWDANASTLAYTEPDTFRKEGIQWILDHALDYHR